MAPVVNLLRLVWSGTLFNDESWSCSVHLNGPAGPAPAVSGYEAAIKAWMSRAASNLSQAATLTEIKLNRIDPVTARYADPLSNNLVVFPTASGTKAVAPGQLSLVVSTRTALARGRGHAGRFYPPTGLPSAIDQAVGAVSTTIQNECAGSAATLLTDVNAVDPSFTCVVFSKAGQSVEVITHVQVGRIYDTMRSRRASLIESPLAATVS